MKDIGASRNFFLSIIHSHVCTIAYTNPCGLWSLALKQHTCQHGFYIDCHCYHFCLPDLKAMGRPDIFKRVFVFIVFPFPYGGLQRIFFLYIYYTFIPLYASALNVSSALYAVHVYKKC